MEFVGKLKERSIDGIPGLYVIITQDADSNQVLMQAYANKEAVLKTVETGLAHYYSTSRHKIWLKGESSGNTQKIIEILVDCDADALIYKVEQKTGACHKGFESCFYRTIKGGDFVENAKPVFDPKKVY